MFEVVSLARARTRAFVATSFLLLIAALALPGTTYGTRYDSFSLRTVDLLIVFWPMYLTITLVLAGVLFPRITRFVLLPAGALLVLVAGYAGVALFSHIGDAGVYALPIVAIVALAFIAALRKAPPDVRLHRIGVAAGVALAALWCGVAAVGTAGAGVLVSVAGAIAWSAACVRRSRPR